MTVTHKFSYVVKIRIGSETCESSWRTNFPRGAGGESGRGDGVRERNRSALRSSETVPRRRREPWPSADGSGERRLCRARSRRFRKGSGGRGRGRGRGGSGGGRSGVKAEAPTDGRGGSGGWSDGSGGT